MKILIVIHYFPPHIGGMESVAQKQAESLIAMGHEVVVFTCRPNKKLLQHASKTPYEVKRVRSLNFIENNFGVTYPLISPLNFFILLKEIPKYDIVHIHDVFYSSSHMAGLAAILRKKPFYLTQHVALVNHPSRAVMRVQKTVYDSIGKLLFMRANSIVTYNVNVQKFLINRGVEESKITLNYNGVDTEYFKPVTNTFKRSLREKYSFPKDKPIILFVGRLVPKKGYDLVYSARSNNYLTLIVGEGIIPKKMKNNEDVVFFGPANSEQLRELYTLSDIFVFPALGEIFTLVMQEAMASGLPVITTNDRGYLGYNLDRHLISFINRDKDSIKSSVERLVKDKGLSKRMSKYSRNLALCNFSWQDNYIREVGIYKSLLEQV